PNVIRKLDIDELLIENSLCSKIRCRVAHQWWYFNGCFDNEGLARTGPAGKRNGAGDLGLEGIAEAGEGAGDG
ncbi:hypothetical protein CEJ83_20295, partial [Acinetobacter baumannii]